MAARPILCLLGSKAFVGFRWSSVCVFGESGRRYETTVARKWTLAKQWEGEPQLSDFRVIEEPVTLSSNAKEILIEAIYLSVDPYMRIKASNTPRFPTGGLVLANVGWRTHTAVPDPDKEELFGPVVRPLPDFGGLSPSLAIGCLGMPGMTGYFGLLDRCQPQAGETVLVSGAAGAVGSIVGQVAKVQGCTVIGSAGSKEKCDWLQELGFDHVFNYKEKSVDEALTEMAPDGVDIYFDNVGGDFTYDVMKSHMKFNGRIAICGAIAQYNAWERERSTTMFIIDKQLNIKGVYVPAYNNRYYEFVAQMSQWIREGKLSTKKQSPMDLRTCRTLLCRFSEDRISGRLLSGLPNPTRTLRTTLNSQMAFV
ncbi:hypothetical protein C0Q70_14661 [Pomacea canaliculata]|uniref:15-oxoprostaglandin 13-reductase n=1 Tax=Pomacea canaliculata TaxID=400727 RepID=A0A2T7NSN9_POMCA|nr:hypothetical protein C0Q70_14661 [Pomacea canaliculata]